ncbi:unnamed protein product, partial [Ixodes persulcatus]
VDDDADVCIFPKFECPAQHLLYCQELPPRIERFIGQFLFSQIIFICIVSPACSEAGSRFWCGVPGRADRLCPWILHWGPSQAHAWRIPVLWPADAAGSLGSTGSPHAGPGSLEG